MHILFDV